eukprot:XP_017951094.1 PREDICTED: olfactory receptor 145-like [Xenopus tropicalis]
MASENVSGFIIQGFSDTPELQISLFVLFLGIYLIILLGNLIIFLVISCNPHLHTPMYIFLQNLSLIDIFSTLDIFPKMLHILLTQQNNISFLGCMTQMYVFLFFAASEYFLLTAMAYDRYVAICDPLHYIARMSRKHCAGLITAAFTVGFVDPLAIVVLLSKLSYCASHLIDHFFCDISPLLQLSCSSTFSVELLIYIEGILLEEAWHTLDLVRCIIAVRKRAFIVSITSDISSMGSKGLSVRICKTKARSSFLDV